MPGAGVIGRVPTFGVGAGVVPLPMGFITGTGFGLGTYPAAGRVPTFGVGAGVPLVQSPLGGVQPPEFAVKVSPVREFLHVTSACEFIESAGGGVKP